MISITYFKSVKNVYKCNKFANPCMGFTLRGIISDLYHKNRHIPTMFKQLPRYKIFIISLANSTFSVKTPHK